MINLPVEFEERMKKLLGEDYGEFLVCYEEDKYQGLRINRLKCGEDRASWDPVFDILQLKEPERVPWTKDGFYYSEGLRPGKHPFHEMGLYYIQEPSAMSAAALLAPEPGMRILDMCAAPGGKTTQLASYLGGKGLLVANEINAQRAAILSQNVERMGIPNCIVTNTDSEGLDNHFGCFFHGILVDAPCSGEGMFRKNAEAAEEWSPDNVALCAARQEEILDHAANLLLPGGRLVYSTCTFAPEENENSIAAFLRRHPDFTVEKTEAPWFAPAVPEWVTAAAPLTEKEQEKIRDTFRLWPQKLHGEGHYAAVLRKAGVLPSYEEEAFSKPDAKKPKGKGGKEKKGKGRKDTAPAIDRDALLKDFLSEHMTAELAAKLLGKGEIISFGDRIYRLPIPGIRTTGMNILRPGLWLGEIKKDRFEPSHSLAMAMRMDEAVLAVNLKNADVRVLKWFNGEAIQVEPEDFTDGKLPKKGWVLFCIEGYPAGWGKVTNQILKNHYPKGLRRNLALS